MERVGQKCGSPDESRDPLKISAGERCILIVLRCFKTLISETLSMVNVNDFAADTLLHMFTSFYIYECGTYHCHVYRMVFNFITYYTPQRSPMYFAQYVEVLDFAQVTIGWVEGCRGCWGARTFWIWPRHAMSQQESTAEKSIKSLWVKLAASCIRSKFLHFNSMNRSEA